MKRLRKLALVAIALCALVCAGCDSAQLVQQVGTVQGTVLDGDGRPVANAAVTVDGTAYRALTNVEGSFVLALPQGDWTLRIRRQDGTETSDLVTVPGGQIVEGLSFRLGDASGSPGEAGLALALDGEDFDPGVPVTMTLTVRNRSSRARAFSFASSQTHDFVVTDEQGVVIWKWSAGRAFVQTASERVLAPEGTWTFVHAWPWWETQGVLERFVDRPLKLRAELCSNDAPAVVHQGAFRLHRIRSEVPIETHVLAEGRVPGSLPKGMTALRSRERLEAFLASLSVDAAALDGTVDFATHMVLALCQGPSRNPDAAIRLRAVEGDTRRWVVHVADLDVWTGAISGSQEPGSAYQLVRIPICAEEPVFVVSHLP